MEKNEQTGQEPLLAGSDNKASANFAKHANYDGETIPDWVFDDLPLLLKDSCAVFNDKIERDIFLTGTLAVLGGAFHDLYAYNEPDKKKVATNLLAIVVGPPASGKGALNYSRKIAKKIKETFAERGKKLGKSSGKKLMIPANISSSGMIQLLTQNDGAGIMVESEIDTIVNANRHEWGNYTEIIRKSFENEEYSMYRKGKDRSEYYDIPRLKLSVAISGTPNQFRQLIYSAENGLFSRGAYYVFEPDNNVLKCIGRTTSDTDMDSKFASFAEIANTYYEHHLGYNEILISLSEEQLLQIENTLQLLQDNLIGKPEFKANIRRAFVLAQKIAAILTFLSNCENENIEPISPCDSKSLDNAIWITTTYLMHAFDAYEMLPSKTMESLNESQQRLIMVLPEKFTMAESIECGEDIGMKKRTIYYVIESLEKKGIIKIQPDGMYKKQ